jgi:hypothetical protein
MLIQYTAHQVHYPLGAQVLPNAIRGKHKELIMWLELQGIKQARGQP